MNGSAPGPKAGRDASLGRALWSWLTLGFFSAFSGFFLVGIVLPELFLVGGPDQERGFPFVYEIIDRLPPRGPSGLSPPVVHLLPLVADLLVYYAASVACAFVVQRLRSRSRSAPPSR